MIAHVVFSCQAVERSISTETEDIIETDGFPHNLVKIACVPPSMMIRFAGKLTLLSPRQKPCKSFKLTSSATVGKGATSAYTHVLTG